MTFQTRWRAFGRGNFHYLLKQLLSQLKFVHPTLCFQGKSPTKCTIMTPCIVLVQFYLWCVKLTEINLSSTGTKRPRTSTTTTSTTTTTVGSKGGSVHSGPPPGHGMGSAGSHTSPNTPPKCGMGCENRSPSFIPSSGLVLLTVVIFVHFWTWQFTE